MAVLLNTKNRSTYPEIMDDFDLKDEELLAALDKIGKINQLLGGNRITKDGVEKLLEKSRSAGLITILDVGCGNGGMLRLLADFAIRRGLEVALIGLDANSYTVAYAEALSKEYPNISYCCRDVFDPSFPKLLDEWKCDIVLCTLTLHHFDDRQIESLLSMFYANAKLGFVINDLHRSAITYRLFQLICSLFQLKGMTRKDGLISILRGFKRGELIGFSQRLQFRKYEIRWRWAFRFQWIVEC